VIGLNRVFLPRVKRNLFFGLQGGLIIHTSGLEYFTNREPPDGG
jgi:hypothetical protein